MDNNKELVVKVIHYHNFPKRFIDGKFVAACLFGYLWYSACKDITALHREINQLKKEAQEGK